MIPIIISLFVSVVIFGVDIRDHLSTIDNSPIDGIETKVEALIYIGAVLFWPLALLARLIYWFIKLK